LLQPYWVTALGLRQELACLAATSRRAALRSPSFFWVQLGRGEWGGCLEPLFILSTAGNGEMGPLFGASLDFGYSWEGGNGALELSSNNPPSAEKPPERKGTPRKGGTSALRSSHREIF